MTEEYVNVFCYDSIKPVGGVEEFFYQLAKKYGNTHNITVLYREADKKQLDRLKRYVKCVRFVGQRVKCKRVFFNFFASMKDYIDAEEKYLIVHFDAKAMVEQGIKRPQQLPHDPSFKYIAVSDLAAKNFTEVTGIPCARCYNPLQLDEPSKVWRFVVASRITDEKGKEELLRYVRCLDEIPDFKYQLFVFSNDKLPQISPNVFQLPARLDVMDFIKASDALIQFTHHESFGYSVEQALSLGVPVIVSDVPAFREIGVNETNSIILNNKFTQKDVDESIERLKKGFKFTYKPLKDDWNKFLAKGKPTYDYNEELNQQVWVECTTRFFDIDAQLLRAKNDIFKCTTDRYEYLSDRGYVIYKREVSKDERDTRKPNVQGKTKTVQGSL